MHRRSSGPLNKLKEDVEEKKQNVVVTIDEDVDVIEDK